MSSIPDLPRAADVTLNIRAIECRSVFDMAQERPSLFPAAPPRGLLNGVRLAHVENVLFVPNILEPA